MKKYKNIIAIGVGVVGAYFVFKYFSQSKKQPTIPVEPPSALPTPTPSIQSGFPIKKGSKGSNVKAVQTIILKIDKSLLPKFGADADFGSETEAAVFKLLGKKTIDNQSDITKLNDILNKKLFPYVTKKEETKPILPPFGIKLF